MRVLVFPRSIALSVLAAPAVLASAVLAQGEGFVERAAAAGLVHAYVSGLDQLGDSAIRDTFQAGVSLADLDGDGDQDVVACGGVGPNRIFLNVGPALGFLDVTKFVPNFDVGELDRCVALGDYDGDGDIDVFVGALEPGMGAVPGKGRLYRNDGNKITERTALAAPLGAGRSVFASWLDLDRDGLLDLYVGEFHGAPNVWYRNNGDGSLTESSEALGVAHPGNTHVAAELDADGDGRPDLLVANDWVVGSWVDTPTNAPDAHLAAGPDHVYADVSAGSGYDQQAGIMGIALGDVDYDGDLDVYKTDVRDNWLMINQGWPASGLPWVDQALAYGVANPLVPDPASPGTFGRSVGWSTAFLHADFDPWIDLFVVNGKVAGLSTTLAYSPGQQPNYLFRSLGPSGGFAFEDVSAAYGITDTVDDRGGAVGDLDGDGDADLLVAPTHGPLRYFENRVDREGQGVLVVRAKTQTSAPGGVGSTVSWTDASGYPHVRPLGGEGPTASQHETAAIFALGSETDVDVTVRFPSGIALTYPDVPANTALVALEPKLVRAPFRTKALVPGEPETFQVLAWAHDATGQPLDATATVTLDVPGLAATGGVTSLGGNLFGRTFETPSSPGSYRIVTAFDDFQVGIEPQLHFYDAADVSGTVALVQPEAIRAGSADVVKVVVAPKAASGVRNKAVTTVSATLDGASAATIKSDDGQWTFTFLAPTRPGIAAVDVQVDGQPVATGLTVEIGGPAVLAVSTLYSEIPIAVQGAAPHVAKLLFTPRDVDGRRLGPKADVVVSATPNPGSEPVTTTLPHPDGRRDGSFPILLEKPAGAAPGSAKGTIRILVDGVQIGAVPYVF